MWARPRRLCQRPCSNKLSHPFMGPGASSFSLSYPQICPSTECSFLKAVPHGPARKVSIRNRWLCICPGPGTSSFGHLSPCERSSSTEIFNGLQYLPVRRMNRAKSWRTNCFPNKTLKKIIAVTTVNRKEGNMMGSIITMTTVQGYFSDQPVNLGKALHGCSMQAMVVARAKGLNVVHEPGKNRNSKHPWVTSFSAGIHPGGARPQLTSTASRDLLVLIFCREMCFSSCLRSFTSAPYLPRVPLSARMK